MLVMKKLMRRFIRSVKEVLKNLVLRESLFRIKKDDDDNTINRFVDIVPKDVLVNILSRLDLVTLCRCVSVSKTLYLLLPEIRNLETTLPRSIIVYREPSSCLGLLASYACDQVLTPINILCHVFPAPLLMSFTLRIWIPKFSKPASEFLLRLNGIESLEIEYTVLDSLCPPNLFFRWFGEPTTKKSFMLCLSGTIVTPRKRNLETENYPTHDPLPWSTLVRQYKDELRRSTFHSHAGNPSSEWTHDYWPNVKTMALKDDRKNGRQIFHSETSNSDPDENIEPFVRQFCCYLPATWETNDLIQIEDAFIYCKYTGSDVDKDMAKDEFVKTLLDDATTSDYYSRQERELVQVVLNMLEHKDLIVIQDVIKVN